MVESDPKEENLVHGIRLSTVCTSRVTGPDVAYELGALDLAMKLNYIKGLYLFSSDAVQGLTVMRAKEPMFPLLTEFYMTSGRFRRTDTGRPYIKCNDCGVRVVEAQCEKTVDEWLELRDRSDLHDLLVYHQPIGPEVSFSPLIYVQLTRFKCGGLSLGLSWSHVLGDASSTAHFINKWGQLLAEAQLGDPPSSPTEPQRSENRLPPDSDPLSVKRVGPVGDVWETANTRKMGTFSFHLSAAQVSHLQAKVSGDDQIPVFESLCAIIWQCIANIRESEPKTVTLCKNNPYDPKNKFLGNNQTITAIEADYYVAGADLKELGKLLVNQAADQRGLIEAAVEADNGVSDFIVYGAHLTFVDMEDANLYGLEVNGHSPKYVHYNIEGVGDEGSVLILPGAKVTNKGNEEGRLVTVTLPEDQISMAKSEFEKSGLLLRTNLE